MKSTSPPTTKAASPFFVGNNLALDFLNSVAGTGDDRIDFLADDEQVLNWLKQAGLPVDKTAHALIRRQPGQLQEVAVALRKTGRALIQRRKAGKQGDPALINRLLLKGGTYQQLSWKPGERPQRITNRRVVVPEDLLIPIAEAIAELLEMGEFQLIRKCANPVCTLWFYDQTKSHRRRWCSMTICGNRTKVTAFRERHRKAE